jgi:hypothetical protein
MAACDEHVMGEHGRAHARAAHLGQGHRTGAGRQAAFEGRLPRGRLALAGHEAIAHQHLGHQIRRNGGALHRGGNGCSAEVVGGQAGKVALQATHGGASGADDNDGIRHDELHRDQRMVDIRLRRLFSTR